MNQHEAGLSPVLSRIGRGWATLGMAWGGVGWCGKLGPSAPLSGTKNIRDLLLAEEVAPAARAAGDRLVPARQVHVNRKARVAPRREPQDDFLGGSSGLPTGSGARFPKIKKCRVPYNFWFCKLSAL